MLKLPMNAALNASIDMLKLRADCTDAVVVLVNNRTGEAQIASMRGDINHTGEILNKALNSLNKQKRPSSGLIGF